MAVSPERGWPPLITQASVSGGAYHKAMQALLLTVLAVAAPTYSLHLGLSDADWKTIVSNTLGHPENGYVVTQVLHAPGGSTLVRWSSTSELDPKGPNGIGIQLYGPGNTFRKWLPNAARIDRKVVQCGRYLVGGNVTLRVWDAETNYGLVQVRDMPNLPASAHLNCLDGGLAIAVPDASGGWRIFRKLVTA